MSLFSCVEIGFIQGKGYNILTDTKLLYNFGNTKKTLGKLSLLYKMAEITLLLIRGEEKDEEIFIFLKESFQKIDTITISGQKLKLFFCFFSFRLLHILGYKLYIEKCAFCGESVKEECYFNPKEGGVVCKNCFLKEPVGIYLENVNSLKSFFEPDIENIFNQNARFFMDILEKYLAFIPETQEKSFI
jgi:DNA repair protein RecO